MKQNKINLFSKFIKESKIVKIVLFPYFYIKYLENLIIKMDKANFKRFMRLQKEEIEKYKYIQSEKAGKDLGNECCQDWISKYAKSFAKKYWEVDK